MEWLMWLWGLKVVLGNQIEFPHMPSFSHPCSQDQAYPIPLQPSSRLAILGAGLQAS